MFITNFIYSDKTDKKLIKFDKLIIERRRHKTNHHGMVSFHKEIVLINEPLPPNNAWGKTNIDYLYLIAQRANGKKKTFLFGLFSEDKLKELQSYIEKIKNKKKNS